MTKKFPVLIKYIFPLLLLLLPLWNVWAGVDVVDTGYSLAYFKFFPGLDGMWFFSTFLANLLGWLIMQLPGGAYLIGMNIYTSLLIGAVAAGTYIVLSKKVPAGIVFAGEVLAVCLCWCPSTILYHYLTYLFFTVAVLLLVFGLCEKKKGLLFLAGVLLGINTFVRMPSNCLEVLLIAVVWYADRLNKETWKETAKKTLVCIAGYLSAAAVILCLLGLTYGFSNYFEAIFQMLGSTETASDYTLKSMILAVLKNMLEGLYWLLLLCLLSAAGVLVQCIGKKKWIFVKTVLCVLLGLTGLFVMRWRGFFDTNYYYHLAVYRPFLVFMWLTVISCVVYLGWKRFEKWEKIWAMAVFVVTLIMPLGTNNHLYANMNNLFFVAPFTLYAVYRLVRYAFLKKNAAALSVSGILLAFLAVFFVQSAGYGMHFILFDNYEQKERNTRIEKMEVLKGMYTYSENAEELEKLYAYLYAKELTGAELITMGNLPGFYYYLDMPCAVSVLWPDLNTSSGKTFQADLQAVTLEMEQGEIPPVVIVSADLAKRLESGNAEGEKEEALQVFLVENGYENGYAGARYAVFEK